MFKNPITEKQYPDKQSYIDSLAQQWKELIVDLYQLQQDEAALIVALLEISNLGLDGTGKAKLEGIDNMIKIDRGINASYQKERDEEHPLAVICNTYSFIKEFVAFDPRERGQSLEKFLQSSEYDSRPEVQAARKAILNRRVTKPAKPTIEIKLKELKDA